MSRRRPVPATLFLFVAIVAVVAHTCVVPTGHAVAGAPIAHDAAGGPHGAAHEAALPAHHAGVAHATHGGACNAASPTGGPEGAPPVVSVVSVVSAAEAAPSRVVSAVVAVRDGAPRLFVLHGAFLI